MNPKKRDRAPSESGVIGIPWYEEVEWTKLKEMLADASSLHDSYALWLGTAESAERELERQGIVVRRVRFYSSPFANWYRMHRKPLNQSAVAEYAAARKITNFVNQPFGNEDERRRAWNAHEQLRVGVLEAIRASFARCKLSPVDEMNVRIIDQFSVADELGIDHSVDVALSHPSILQPRLLASLHALISENFRKWRVRFLGHSHDDNVSVQHEGIEYLESLLHPDDDKRLSEICRMVTQAYHRRYGSRIKEFKAVKAALAADWPPKEVCRVIACVSNPEYRAWFVMEGPDTYRFICSRPDDAMEAESYTVDARGGVGILHEGVQSAFWLRAYEFSTPERTVLFDDTKKGAVVEVPLLPFQAFDDQSAT